ncbi:MAG: hypothetical protein HY303_22260, partial [Candidatus Wallbacteria bacterium]|nr:hypothetical protein [Candidatus Wallbacteria bacterium]
MEPSQRNGQPQTPHRATTIRPALGSLFAVMLLATGCGVGSDATGTPTAAGTSVFGRAAAGGPIASGGTPKAGKGAVFEAAGGGEVKAYKLLATGLKDPTPSGLLARAPVQALGAFELKIPNSYTGPVLLEVTGNYENPAGNAPGTACATDTFSADKPLISIIPNYVPGTTLTKANISPLTHIAARRAQKLGADAGKLTGSLVRDALRQAAGALSLGALATGDTDSVENSNPIDPGRGSRPGATVGEQQYGLLMAGLDQEACKLKVPLVDLLERMGSDLAADGRLDADASGQSLDLTNRDNQTVVYSLATLTSDLKLAIDEFVDNRQANLSGISLTDLVKTDLTDDLNFPTPPVAGIATLPSNPPAGTVIRLDGTGSIKTRTGGVLAYTWTVTRSGQPVTVTGTTSPNASFTADVQGVYTISLIVNDGRRIGSTSVQLNVGVVTTTTLTVSQPQLSSSTVLAGGTIVATFSVTNTGTIAATQVTPLLTFNRTGSAADGDFSGLSFTPSTTTIAAGLSQTFTAQVTVVPTAQTEHVLVTAQAQATEAPPALSQAAGLDVQAATLQVASFQLTPSSTSPGFGFTAKLEVRNTGAADALGVTPTFGFRTSGGAARVSFGTTSPASVGIPASGLRTFTVPIVVQAQAPLGPLTLTATVHGTNTNTAAASDRTLQIVAVPTATLSAASLTVTPSTTEQGGAALATLTVRNTSANPAYAVAPTFAFSRAGGPPSGLTTGSVNPLTATIQPFTQQVFSAPISVSAVAAAGAYTITAAAAGSNGGTPAATTASLTVLVPAALTMTALNASPTALTTGQSYVATATILNAGGTAAHVTAVSFGVTFTGTVSPSTADISPGLTKTFTLTNATGFASPGSFTLSTVGVTGTDSASGRSLGQAGNTAGSVTFSVQQFPGLTLGTVAVS